VHFGLTGEHSEHRKARVRFSGSFCPFAIPQYVIPVLISTIMKLAMAALASDKILSASKLHLRSDESRPSKDGGRVHDVMAYERKIRREKERRVPALPLRFTKRTTQLLVSPKKVIVLPSEDNTVRTVSR
jgi:hypothetical protein